MLSGYITYFESDSPVARLDARVKLIIVVCMLILVFFWTNPIYLAVTVLAIIAFSLMGGIKLKYLLNLMKFTIPFVIILFLMHALTNRWYGATPWLGPLPDWVPLLGGHLTLQLLQSGNGNSRQIQEIRTIRTQFIHLFSGNPAIDHVDKITTFSNSPGQEDVLVEDSNMAQ